MKATAKALMILLALTFVFAGAAGAQTADGETPAEEIWCDAESGAAFGLCNAYCEAMDCHLANDGDPTTLPHASDKACNRVGTKFTQITGKSPLCEATVQCPCTAGATWNQFATGEAASSDCFDDGNVVSLVDLSGGFESANGASVDQGGLLCETLENGSVTETVSLTADQAAACAQMLTDEASIQGLACG